MKPDSKKLTTGSDDERLDQTARFLDHIFAQAMDQNDAALRRDGVSEELIARFHRDSLKVSAKERARILAVIEAEMLKS
jgi:hypothetical protein